MSDLVRQGLAVVMVSSELPEMLGMADRILVMARGRMRGDLLRATEANPEIIARARRRTHEAPLAAIGPPLAPHDAVLAALTALVLFARRHRALSGIRRAANLADILDDTAILIILALAQMTVLVTRAVDLSVAANLALTGMVVALSTLPSRRSASRS